MTKLSKEDYLEKSKKYYDKRFGDRELQTKKLTEEEVIRLARLQNIIAKFRSEKPENSIFRILDFGCGRGWLSNAMQAFGDVTGVDLSPEAIISAKETYPQVTFLSLDASSKEHDLIAESEFDLVFSSEVIEHVSEQLSYLQNAAKYLKPGGRLVLTTPNGDWKKHYFFGERENWGQPFEFWLKPAELETLLQNAGMKNIHLETFNSNWIFDMPSFGKLRMLGHPLLRRLMSVSGIKKIYLNYLEKNGYGLYILVTAIKK